MTRVMKNLDEAFLSSGVKGARWKVSKIMPLLHRVVGCTGNSEVCLLDVGGGTGLVLNRISSCIEKTYDVKVRKLALDLSPKLLEIQKKTNPDLEKALNEDICKTSLGNKEIDLTLMIDVLEHLPDPKGTLEELRRISDFAIFKVPLEDNLHRRLLNLLTRGKYRQHDMENVGHINTYNFVKLQQQIENHFGQILDFHFTNVFDLDRAWSTMDFHLTNVFDLDGAFGTSANLINSFAACIFELSPRMCSIMFYDFVVILAKGYPTREKRGAEIETRRVI